MLEYQWLNPHGLVEKLQQQIVEPLHFGEFKPSAPDMLEETAKGTPEFAYELYKAQIIHANEQAGQISFERDPFSQTPYESLELELFTSIHINSPLGRKRLSPLVVAVTVYKLEDMPKSEFEASRTDYRAWYLFGIIPILLERRKIKALPDSLFYATENVQSTPVREFIS